jgi:hypothetical protein
VEKQAHDQAKDQLGIRASGLGCDAVWNLERHDLRCFVINDLFQAGDVFEELKIGW